jgi:multiple sugar transport system substrate-binding protein
MIRIVGVLGIALLLSAACVALEPSFARAPEQTPVTFLISGDPADEEAYRTLVEHFMAEVPEIRVELLNIPGQGDFRRRLTADFAAGTPPDIFLINYRRYGPFAARDAIAPIDAFLAQSDVLRREDFHPQALAAFTWRGELMCMPQNMSSPVIYYNKDLFDAAGLPYPTNDWRWDDFVIAAQMLTRDLNGDGEIDQYGFGVEAALVRAAPFIWMNGGEIVDDPAAPTALALAEPASREALAWFVDLQNAHRVVPDAVAEAAESSLSRFLNGRLAMLMESRRVVPEFRRIETFDWDAAPLPQGKERASILHSDAFCIAAASPHREAAWRFVEFANTRAGQTILARSGRTIPSRIDLAQDPAFLDAQARPHNSRIFLDAIPTLRAFPALATWADIEGAVDAELKQAFYGQIALDDAIAAATMRSAEFFFRQE